MANTYRQWRTEPRAPSVSGAPGGLSAGAGRVQGASVVPRLHLIELLAKTVISWISLTNRIPGIPLDSFKMLKKYSPGIFSEILQK